MAWCRNNEAIAEAIDCWYVLQLGGPDMSSRQAFLLYHPQQKGCFVVSPSTRVASCVELILSLLLIHMPQVGSPLRLD